MKKGVELSMNTIIIAAIALIVLIVLVIIFTGQSGKFTRGINDCARKGGVPCTRTATECVNMGGVPSGQCILYDGKGERITGSENEVCCVVNKK